MSIIVFGGTGNVGRIMVKKLLKLNYFVKVLTRDSNKIIEDNNLKYINGNVLDYNYVRNIIDKEDLIIISLGFNNSSFDTMSKGTQNIITVMLEKDCNRLVCISAQGAGDSWNYMPDSFKEMVTNDSILSSSFKDHTNQEEVIKKTELNWTIVRPTEIIDSPETGDYLINGFNEKLKYQISKYDVSQFVVNELFQCNYLQSIAMITS